MREIYENKLDILFKRLRAKKERDKQRKNMSQENGEKKELFSCFFEVCECWFGCKKIIVNEIIQEKKV